MVCSLCPRGQRGGWMPGPLPGGGHVAHLLAGHLLLASDFWGAEAPADEQGQFLSRGPRSASGTDGKACAWLGYDGSLPRDRPQVTVRKGQAGAPGGPEGGPGSAPERAVCGAAGEVAGRLGRSGSAVGPEPYVAGRGSWELQKRVWGSRGGRSSCGHFRL